MKELLDSLLGLLPQGLASVLAEALGLSLVAYLVLDRTIMGGRRKRNRKRRRRLMNENLLNNNKSSAITAQDKEEEEEEAENAEIEANPNEIMEEGEEERCCNNAAEEGQEEEEEELFSAHESDHEIKDHAPQLEEDFRHHNGVDGIKTASVMNQAQTEEILEETVEEEKGVTAELAESEEKAVANYSKRNIVDDDHEQVEVLRALLAQKEEEASLLRARGEEVEERLAGMEIDLPREKSRAEMLALELVNQDKIWTVKFEQCEDLLRSSREETEKCQAELCLQRETFQRSYSQLRAALEDRDSHLREKEDSNRLLRKDLLEVVTQFDAEKTNLERRVVENRERNRELEEELAERREEVARLECDLATASKKAEKRGRDRKKLHREMERLKQELGEVYKNHERGIKVARILDHIDNID